jgi:hypothetical protein
LKFNSNKFLESHKKSIKDFTRNRKLGFKEVFCLVLRKSVKSVQININELMISLGKINSLATASAFSQARNKLKHTAFIELNDDIRDIFYEDNSHKKFHNFRIVGLDGSKIILPNSLEIANEFGLISIANNTGNDLGSYSSLTLLCFYDVLNSIEISSSLNKGVGFEPNFALPHLHKLSENDLLVCDRGFVGYPFFARITARKQDYLIRFPKSTFKEVNEFLSSSNDDQIVKINVPSKHSKSIKLNNLPKSIKIRLIKVILPTGEIEVLGTSLFDKNKFTIKDFAYLYNKRWGIETFFGKLKGRLSLENFTGKSTESIKQDIWSTIFISNLETILTEETEDMINQNRSEKLLPKAVNKSISFNAIKNKSLDLLYSKKSVNKILIELKTLFKLNTLVIRENRNIARHPTSHIKSYNFQKRIRKHVF